MGRADSRKRLTEERRNLCWEAIERQRHANPHTTTELHLGAWYLGDGDAVRERTARAAAAIGRVFARLGGRGPCHVEAGGQTMNLIYRWSETSIVRAAADIVRDMPTHQ